MKNFIKKMLRESLLDEGKQVGPLYHFTSLKRSVMILAENHMKIHTENGVTGIPMTRDKNFWNIERSVNGTDVRLEFDGNKISNRFRIQPFNAFQLSARSLKSHETVESEERVIVKDMRKFNVSDYLVNITVNLDTIINYVKFKNQESENFGADILETLDILKKFRQVAGYHNVPIIWEAKEVFADATIADSIKVYLKNLMK